jgi:hypothetical protein
MQPSTRWIDRETPISRLLTLVSGLALQYAINGSLTPAQFDECVNDLVPFGSIASVSSRVHWSPSLSLAAGPYVLVLFLAD